MKKTRNNSEAQKSSRPARESLLSPHVEELLLSPIEVPSSFDADLESFHESAAEIINHTIAKAITDGVLPKSIQLAQFTSVNQANSRMELKAPALVRKSAKPGWESLVQRFCYIAVHNLKENRFFYQRVASFVHSPNGTIFVIQGNLSPEEQELNGLPEIPQIHLLHLKYRSDPEAEGSFAFLDDVKLVEARAPTQNKTFGWFDLKAIAERAGNQKPLRKLPEKAVWQRPGFPKLQSSHAKGRASHELKQLEDSIGNDSEYLARIFPSACCGNIVLCAPRPIYFEHRAAVGASRRSLNEQLWTFGLSLVIDKSEPLTPDLLLRCHLMAQKLGMLVSSSFNLAEKSAWHASRQQKDFTLAAAAHVLLGPVSNFEQWLKRAISNNTLDQESVQCALASISLAKQNAHTIIALAPLEQQSENAVSLAPTDLGQLVKGIFEFVELEFKLFQEGGITAGFTATQVPLVETNPAILSVAITELLRNAFEHVTDNRAAAETHLAHAAEDVVVSVAFDGSSVVIAMENGGPVPPEDAINSLNKPADIDLTTLLARRNADHYGVGTQTAKWLLRNKLRAQCKFKSQNSRLVCEVRFPVAKDNRTSP